jgi:hypothetical protein
MKRWIALGALALALAGCGKQIGDECESATECISTDTDRICLTQSGEGFPNGYCSQFNCSPDSCPEEAACVAYRRTLGGGECADQANRSRLERTYCMLRCNNDGDCRSGYKCMTADGDNSLGAAIIDRKSDVKICALDYIEPRRQPERESEVCEVKVFNEPATSTSNEGSDGMSSDSVPDANAREGGAPDAFTPDATALQSSEESSSSAQ